MVEYNYLDLLGQRQLSYLPPQFVSTKIGEQEYFSNLTKIVPWVRSKLKGRFSVSRIPMISNNDRLQSEYVIAFEDHQELTYFLLACPYIRRN